jgi:menaquinol-cytochrome c reductase iron-sulfur subunit
MSSEHDEHDGHEGEGSKPGDASHAPATPADPQLIARRQLLSKVSLGLGAAGGVALGAPMVGFVIGPLFKGMGKAPPSPDAPEWRDVGKLEGSRLMITGDDGKVSAADFAPGTTLETPVVFADASSLPWSGVTGRTAAYLRRVSDTECIAFAINCAHLGCPVRWLPKAGLFMCPCHGGVYYADGSVAAGPPPHALFRYPVQIKDGRVLIWPSPLPVD